MMQSAMLPIVSATAALQKSEQQRKRRHQDKAFLDDYSKGASMTSYEEEKGKRMECTRQRKNQKQRERNREHVEDCDYRSWRKVFFKKKKHDFISISVPVNEFIIEEEYKKVLDCRDAMRASVRLVDEKWVELMEQSKENLVVVFFHNNGL